VAPDALKLGAENAVETWPTTFHAGEMRQPRASSPVLAVP
jgi:hypothetical protein